MSELRYPNESKVYRDAREALRKDEQELLDKVKVVAARRRALPPGGELKEDYVFQWAGGGEAGRKLGERVKFSELFGGKNTLILYSWMFGPSWDKPCPSCTSLMDGFDRSWYAVSRDAAFAGIAKAPAEKIDAWAKQRGWSPGRDRRHAAGVDAHVRQARRQDFSVLVSRRERRHGMAVLESDRLHAGGAAGQAHTAAEVQAGVF